MSKEIVAGRSALKRSFREIFIRTIDDGKDTRSFLPFRKQREQPISPPWIFLFHGEECLGKSTAIRSCTAVADELTLELKKTLTTVTVDWEKWSFTKGDLPVSTVELMDAIASLFVETNSEFTGGFSSFRTMSESFRKNQALVASAQKSFHLKKALDELNSENTDEENSEPDQFSLKSALSPKDFELYENGETKCTELLVRAVNGAAEENPLILVIDSYHCLSPELDQWFRENFLNKIAEQRTQLLVFIGAHSRHLRDFRNNFSDENLFAVNFSDSTLTRQVIKLLASKWRVTLSDEESALVESVTAGIPLLVNDILFHAAQGTAISEMCDSNLINDVHAAETLSGTVLDRFFTRCADTTVRDRIFALAMLIQFNPKALAEIWNIPFSDVNKTLSETEKHVSFICNREMHHHIRKQLRASLVQEAANGAQSSLRPFFQNFSSNCVHIFGELLKQLQTAVPSAEKRCHDPRYLVAIEQMICGMMWSAPTDAFIALPGYFIELLHFNTAAAKKLLVGITEFHSLFSPVNDKIFKQLINGLAIAESRNIFAEAVVKPIEEEMIAYFESVSESMTDFQRALLHHLKADVALRKDNLKEAMEHLDHSFSLLGNSAPEKSILYEAYVLLGSSFNLNEEHRNAIATFSSAVLIHADGFIPWYSMGLSRMALDEFEGAINTLNEAVKINPDHTGAWYNLGISYVKEQQHAEAVNAFLKAAETAPERPAVWFSLGESYVVLEKYTEAVTAFRKVVLAEPENADAWILLGQSCSSLGKSDDAIEAYQKAIDLTPRSLVAIKSLGEEFFKQSRFTESIKTFVKASRINKSDPDLWCFIAEANIGAGEYEKAVAAGNKALAIDENCSRALHAIGNAEMADQNHDAAINAFTKAVEIEPDNAEIWQKLGSIYNNQEEHDLAIEAFKKAVVFNPDLKEVWYTIGRAYETQDKYAEAVASYEKGTQVDPKNIDCWIHKGQMHEMLEQFEDAFECYSEVVKLNPELFDGWFSRGRTAIATEKFKDAVESFGKAVGIEAANADGWFHLGCAYQKRNDHQEAIRSFTEAATLDDQRTDIWYQLGVSCQILGIYEEAIQAYEKCTAIDGENPEYPTRLGTCYYTIENYDKAYNAFTKAVDLDPDNHETLYQLALTCHAQENFPEAIRNYLTIINADEENAEARFNMALAYHTNMQYERAIDAYLVYVNKWPDNGQAWFNLGLAYHAANDIDNAILSYKEASKLLPEQPDVWYHLGMVLHTKEQFGDAIQAYRKVLQFNADHLDAWFNLGLAYYVWQNYVDSIESYTSVVKRDPKHLPAWGNLAIANYANKDFKRGFDAAKHAFELNSDEPWIIANMVVGALFAADSLQAQEYFDKLLATDVPDELLIQTLHQIKTGLKDFPDTEGGDILLKKCEEALMHPATEEAQ